MIYQIGYDSFEDSKYIMLERTPKDGDPEFKRFVFEATRIVLRKELLEGKNIDKISFCQIIIKVAGVLCETYGFRKILPDDKWSCFGWPAILDKNDWIGERDKNIDELYDYLKEHKRMILEHV